MRRQLFAAAAGAAILLVAGSANAAFNFTNAAGNFNTPTGTEGTETFQNLDGLTGNEVFKYGFGSPAELGPNILSFASGSAAVVNQGVDFVLGTLSYHNSATTGNDELVTIDLGITPTISFNGSSINAAASYMFSIDNTSNAPPCQFSGGDPCADQIVITALSAGVQTFTIGGQTLRLFVDGFLDSNGHIQSSFVGSENSTTTAQLVGRFDLTTNTTPGAPEPAAWAMMLVGFGGLGAVMRRRRAHPLVA
jgi:hypothetical protein